MLAKLYFGRYCEYALCKIYVISSLISLPLLHRFCVYASGNQSHQNPSLQLKQGVGLVRLSKVMEYYQMSNDRQYYSTDHT